MADKKSNSQQIHQAVLDEENQSLKVSVVSGGGGGVGGTDINLIQIKGAPVTTGIGASAAGTQRVVLATDQTPVPVDVQDLSLAVTLNKDDDSVTVYAPDNNTTPIPVLTSNVMVPVAHDYISRTVQTTSETYTFKSGGSSGTVVKTLVITYTDATKSELLSVASV